MKKLSRTAKARALGAGWLLGAATALAQGAAPLSAPGLKAPAAAPAPSFARTADGDATGITPLVALGRSELRQGGFIDTAEALQRAVPTVNFPRTAIDDGSAHLPPFSVRGLSPDHTLVLVNGHRRHATALLNVNNTIGRGAMTTALGSVPLGALESVEMLPDGSDARFGSGAVGGVINLKLREDGGRGFTGFWGQTRAGDGDVWQGVFGAGGRLGQNGTLNVTVAVRERSGTDRATPDTRQQYFGTDTATGASTPVAGSVGSGTGVPATGTVFDPREVAVDRNVQRFGDAELRKQAAAVNARLPVGAASEVYAFGDFSLVRGESAAFFRRPGDARTVRALWPAGFLPLLQSRIADWSFAAGWRGRSAGWTFDLGAIAGSNTIAYDVTQTNNASLGARSPREFYAGKLGYAESTVNLDLAHALHLGLARPAAVAVGVEYRRENYRIAPGSDDSWRDGQAVVLDGPDAGRDAAQGAQGFPGFRPVDAVDRVRNVGAVHVDVTQAVNERLLLALAARYEKTDDLGETTDGRASARLALWSGAALRGSVGTSYRQPHLAQQWFSSTATNFIGGLPFENRTFPVADPVARALGAQSLRPEHATTLGAGFALQPSKAWSLEVDFYRVDLRDRLILTSNFIGSTVATFLESKGVSGATGGRFFSNDAATRTEGFDFAAAWRHEWSADRRLQLRAAYNLNRSRLTHVGATPAGLAALGVTTPLFDLTEEIRLTRGQPRDNLRLSAAWDIGRFQAFLRVSRFGEWEAVALGNTTAEQIAVLAPGYRTRAVTQTLAPASAGGGGAPVLGGPTTVTQLVQIFDAKWVTDLDLRYRLTDAIRWSVGAANLFDIYPGRNLGSRVVNGRAYAGNDNGGTTPYSSMAPFGFNGAFFYSKVDVRF